MTSNDHPDLLAACRALAVATIEDGMATVSPVWLAGDDDGPFRSPAPGHDRPEGRP